MAGRRAERVGRQVVQALAKAVEASVHDPRLAGVTFTSASASDDLRNVRVYFTVFGGEAARADAQRGLAAAAGFLRREVAQRLDLRYAPQLAFEYDAAIATAERIEKLLRDTAPDREDDPQD